MKLHALLTTLACTLVFASTALAVPIQVDYQVIADHCDDLYVPYNVDELGFIGAFPADEQIDANDIPSPVFACPDSANSGIGSQQVTIFNLTKRYFDNLWYVSDPETDLTNVDGLVNGEEAFKIDNVGVNRPLVNESITANGIFEPGESWDFIIDGYTNSLGLVASAFFSPGAVGLGSSGDTASSGSIIATEYRVPEPGTLALLGIGVALVALRRRD